MAGLIRAHDWAASPLGPIESWPQSLRTAVEFVLSSAFPSSLLWGTQATLIYNDRLVRLLGDLHPHVLGLPIFEALPESRSDWEPALCRVMSGESVALGETCHVIAGNGVAQEVWVNRFASPVRDESGAVAGLRAAFIDITANVHEEQRRHEAEEALRASREMHEVALDAARMAAWRWNLHRRVYGGDPSLFALFGLPPSDEMVPVDRFLNLMSPDSRLRIEAAMNTGLAPGQIFNEEISLASGPHAGRIIAFQGRAGTENPALITGVSFDVTEQRRTEQALRVSEARYRQLFNSIDEGFCVIEMIFDDAGKPVDYRFLEVNASFERLTGLIDPVGKTMRSFQPELEEYWFEFYGRIARTGKPERTQNAAKSLGRYYDVYAFRVGAPEECKVGVLFNDISARKAAEEQRILLIKELNHRVKNTLAVVQALARQSRGGTDMPKSVHDAFEGRLAALAEAHDLLMETSWENASLKTVAESAIRPCGLEAERFSISGPPVMLRPQQAVAITMALHELCTNAIKYGALSNETGQIKIEWHVSSRAEPWMRLEWSVRGGPPDTPPARRGFGSIMVERALAHELDAEVIMDFRREGLVCTLETSLSALGETE